jgi:nucleoredoxin
MMAEEQHNPQSLFNSSERDYLLRNNGDQIPVADLVGKRVCVYFSAHWCPPCRAFTPKLAEAYNAIKAKDKAFEVIFISSDRDESSFEEYFSTMPWLALPFGDKRKESLSRIFKVRGIPMLVALGPTGQTVTTAARDLVMSHGADAYPFTQERLKEIEQGYEEMAKGWPEKVKHDLHIEHELELARCQIYACDGCDESGKVWSYKCEECDFDLHPKCALGEDANMEDSKEEGTTKEGWICDGDVCYKA